MSEPQIKAYPAPEPGDIVWCRFPEDKTIQPGPKPRPALILSVMDDQHPIRVRIVYGTSQNLIPVRKGDLVIREKPEAAYKMAGLSYPTKFRFTKVVVLPYTKNYFDLAPLGGDLVASTPRLGMLHPSLVSEANRAAKEAGLIK